MQTALWMIPAAAAVIVGSLCIANEKMKAIFSRENIFRPAEANKN